MAKVSQMQGVPAHIETLKAMGKRRHPAYCKFHEGTGKTRICKCNRCSKYLLSCNSASKCDCYEQMEDN
ncbi:MAG: hypothetical protein IJZ64_00575 [Ruminococcus sp.]|nr:hypothetical protein [Ruminococcus sp.]